MSASPRRSKGTDGRFLTALEHFRSYLGLGHNAFARRLGISHSYWHQLRTGKRPITSQFAERVLVERPDLRHAYTDDLLARVKARVRSPVRGARSRRSPGGAAA